ARLPAGRLRNIYSDYQRSARRQERRGAVSFAACDIQHPLPFDISASESIAVHMLPECDSSADLGNHPLAGIIVKNERFCLIHVTPLACSPPACADKSERRWEFRRDQPAFQKPGKHETLASVPPVLCLHRKVGSALT